LTTVWLRFEIGIQTNYTVVHQPASICIFYGDKLFLVTGESYQRSGNALYFDSLDFFGSFLGQACPEHFSESGPVPRNAASQGQK